VTSVIERPREEEQERHPLARTHESRRLRKRTPFLRDPVRRGSALLFLVSSGAYFALGYWTTVVKHVTIFDSVARLAHAYFVWWNAPPKLAAIGFYWPPVSTLVFLPVTAIKPLATSLVALPLVTAICAGGLLVVLDKTARLVGMQWYLRYPLLLAFALNPMIAFYATNGMSEMPALFLLALGFYEFLGWFLTREARFLVVAGIAFSLAALTRYEVMAYAFLIVPIMTAAMIRQRVSRDALEGSLIAYLAPVAYGMGLWIFMNWLVLGDPVAFLHGGVAHSGATVNPDTHTGSAHHAAAVVAAAAPPVPHIPLAVIARLLLDMNWQLFLPIVVVGAALLVAFVLRRDLMALSLAAAVATNAATTAFFMLQTGQPGFLQLRYNMRSMPLAIVGICWLYAGWRRAWVRNAIAVAGIAVVAAAIPVTWHAMDAYPYQYGEQAFYDAVGKGEDMEGKAVKLNYVMGVTPDKEMADYIDRNVHRRDAVLTDDAQSLTVMLLSGHPEYFFDRIDEGDARWYEGAREPYGRFGYVLVTMTSMPAQVNGFILDWMRFVYPNLVLTPRKATPGFTLVFENSRYRLYRVARKLSPARPRASMRTPR
jgi:hypothetical protein